MTDRKTRLAMLDGLAAAGRPAPGQAPGNRALRAARDAVDAHRVWEVDPALIDDDRPADRLEPEDVADLRDSIETSGQVVPILLRRNPADPDRYLLVYGRRRLEAVRASDSVAKVRALVATLDDDAATRAQVSENMARRDLTYIEKALFARGLVASGFGSQAEVAEVLTVARSAISMAGTILDAVGADLARAIGPAPGIGRPRWDALGQAVQTSGADAAALIDLAGRIRTEAEAAHGLGTAKPDAPEPSVAAFEAVMAAVAAPARRARAPHPGPRPLRAGGKRAATLRRSAKGVHLDLPPGAFADWLEETAPDLIPELHARFLCGAEDRPETETGGKPKA